MQLAILNNAIAEGAYEQTVPVPIQLTDSEKTQLGETYAEADEKAGRDVLAYAVRFPTILFIVFGIIALWFRSRGGYKPIELET